MSDYADVIITNARVFTSNEKQPKADALAVKGNRIIYVGTASGGLWKSVSAGANFRPVFAGG